MPGSGDGGEVIPLVKISLLEGSRSVKDKEAIHAAVHKALMDSLGIPEWDFFHRVYEFPESDFRFPDTKTSKFMILEICLYPGRTFKQKKRMYKALCDNLEEVGTGRADVFIKVMESPLENWGIRGGIPASDVFGSRQSPKDGQSG